MSGVRNFVVTMEIESVVVCIVMLASLLLG